MKNISNFQFLPSSISDPRMRLSRTLQVLNFAPIRHVVFELAIS